MKSKLLFKILFILWLALLLILTSYPKLSIPNDKLLNIDKLGHYFFYLILALLFVLMNLDKPAKRIRINLLKIMLIMPLLDELHQIPIPGRSFSFYDLLADILGFLTIIYLFRDETIISKLRKILIK